MRTKVSEIISSFDFYNRIGEYRDGDTLDLVIDFDVPEDMRLIIDDENRIDMVKEMFDHMRDKHVKSPSSTHRPYRVMKFEEYIKEGISPKTQSYMGKLNDCTLDDEDDFLEEE